MEWVAEGQGSVEQRELVRTDAAGDTRGFLADLRAVLGSVGSRLSTPSEVVGAWLGFVEECEVGYGDNIYEFDNDLSVRSLIEKVLGDPRMSDYPQLGWVREEIAAIDARYRALLGEEEVRPSHPWWEARVPRFAGEEVAADLMARYGVTVDVVS